MDVLRYAASHLAILDVLEPHWDEPESRILRLRDKAIAEGLLVAYLANRLPEHDRPQREIVDVLDVVTGELLTLRTKALLRRFPQTAASMGLACLLASAMGRSNPEVEQLVARHFSSKRALLSEKAPFRLMDVEWTRYVSGVAGYEALRALFPYTTLAAAPHPVYMAPEDEYAFTHAIFYLTDFGKRSGPELVDSAIVDPFLAWSTVRSEFDLLGEHLVASFALGRVATPYLYFALGAFVRQWHSPSGLIGPDFSEVHGRKESDPAAIALRFRHNYHTIFVAGILSAVALAQSPFGTAQPPTAVPDWFGLARRCRSAAKSAIPRVPGVRATWELTFPGDAAVEGIVASLLTTLDRSVAEPPIWLSVLTENAYPVDEVSGVLADGLVIALVKEYRLTQLAGHLAACCRDPAHRSVTVAEGLEFLLDQQLPDGTFGIQGMFISDGAAGEEAQRAIVCCLDDIERYLERPA